MAWNMQINPHGTPARASSSFEHTCKLSAVRSWGTLLPCTGRDQPMISCKGTNGKLLNKNQALASCQKVLFNLRPWCVEIRRVLFLEQTMVPPGHVSQNCGQGVKLWHHVITSVLRNEPREWWDVAKYFGLGKKPKHAKHGKMAIIYLKT